ncbi:MAG: carbohydrate ABC transporter substrate-binding protein [Actinobacteria bacterium]|nr:carbohydrate ABC transporter substrate-binding protein [Actinomycetota bacterium]
MEFSGFVGGPGILTQTEDAIKVFNTENPKYKMTFVQGQLNQPPLQQLTAMYAAGNVPTVFVLDTSSVHLVSDKLLDLSGEPWVDNAYPWAKAQGTIDGKVLGVPASVTAIGFLYNKKLVEKAIGGPFDPATVRTRTDLERLFATVKSSGVAAATQVSPLNWSLGAQYMGKLYDAQGDDAARAKFLADLRAGKVDLMSNAVFNGLMDTLDLMRTYNLNAAKPLTGTIDTDSKAFADGKVAFWFMGDFQWPVLQALGLDPASDDYGILPVPVSNDPTDPWNQKLMASSSFMLCIDKTVSTPEQQAAAKAYLNWYITSPSGQDYMVTKAGQVPAYSNVKLPPSNPLGRAVAADVSSGGTYSPVLDLPADHLPVVGDIMVKYLDGKLDRAAVAKAIQAYWTSAK